MTPKTESELLVNDLDSDFKYRLAEKVGDPGFLHCLSCGQCSASCPVRRLEEKYNPRRLIRMAILGLKEEVYRSEFIWICSYHYTCLRRCPQGVNIGAVADAVARLADEERAAAASARPGLIAAADLDRKFKTRIMTAVAEVGRCFTCGSCTAVCPETLLDETHDPRRFIRLVNLGLRQQAFADGFKDLCATHYRCLSRCPQGVNINKIMNALRELAQEDGYTYPASLAALEKNAV
ncbi:MAG: 4Fe-4S dicluster domain-containing protein [candidate division WOR-3 bacterium]